MASKRVVSLFLLLLIGVQMRGSNGLSNFYYGMSCPFVEMIVRNVVNQALQKDPTLAAGLLRLHFHDCFVQVKNYLNLFHIFTTLCRLSSSIAIMYRDVTFIRNMIRLLLHKPQIKNNCTCHLQKSLT